MSAQHQLKYSDLSHPYRTQQISSSQQEVIVLNWSWQKNKNHSPKWHRGRTGPLQSQKHRSLPLSLLICASEYQPIPALQHGLALLLLAQGTPYTRGSFTSCTASLKHPKPAVWPASGFHELPTFNRRPLLKLGRCGKESPLTALNMEPAYTWKLIQNPGGCEWLRLTTE